MSNNSLTAYANLCETGNLTRMQLAVIGALQQLNRPATMHEVAAYMGVELNCISGRFGELTYPGGPLKVIGKRSFKRGGRDYPRTLYGLRKSELKQCCPVEE